jgi:Domain of unknown function (DUF4430)
MNPITLQVIDEKGNKLVNASVPFSIGINVQQIMDLAFVMAQSAQSPDPFLYTVEYYGYSQNPQFPVYLGYEIESIGLNQSGMKPTNGQFYWALTVNGQPSQTGADSTFPPPGSTIIWTYTPISPTPPNLPLRTKEIHLRRAARLPK